MASIFGDDLYEFANETFDEVVFSGPDGDRLLYAYNERKDSGATDLLFEIVRLAEEAAKDAVKEAITSYIEGRKQEFIDFLEDRE